MEPWRGTLPMCRSWIWDSGCDKNPVFYGKTKHFKLKLYFLREVQREGEIQLIYCKTENQNADILTKPLPKAKYEFLRQRFGVCSFRAKEEC